MSAVKKFLLRPAWWLANRLSERNKSSLRRLRNKVRFIIRRLNRSTIHNAHVAQELAPIFVVGTNRSGSSVCTLMLSRHPDIEGLFQGPETGHRINVDGHSSSGAEANHIWQGLVTPDYDPTVGESVLWGLPESISKLYVGSVSASDKGQLIDEFLSARSTSKIPMMMNSHNVFRIRLIKEMFPKARFVYMTRDHKSFIKSGKHKWSADREVGILRSDSYIDYPHIGLHWLLINSIALYDLNKHAPGDYIHIKLQDLQGEPSLRTETINRVIDFLGLDQIESPDDVFDDSYIFTRSEGGTEMDALSDLVRALINYESSLP